MELGARTGCVYADTLKDKMLVLKDLGYDFLELPLTREEIDAMNKEYVTSIQKLIKETGLPIRNTSTGVGAFAEQFKDQSTRQIVLERITKMIDLSEKCEADAILVAINEKNLPFNEYVGIYIEGLKGPADYAKDRGITLALEHVGTYKPSTLEKLVRAINHDAVKVYFDIGNAVWQGENPVELARKMGDIIAQLHIKGLRRTESRPTECRLDEMPLVEIREALEQHGYKGRGCLEIQAEPGNNPLKEALRILRKAGY